MELFVFPLGHFVFFPNTSKPLNIFEPRYLQLVRDSVRTKTPIAIGFVDEPDLPYEYQFGNALGFVRPIVGYGQPTILEERPDGSILILLQGSAKARLGRVQDRGTPYIVCAAEPIAEKTEIDASHLLIYMGLQRVLIQWIKNHFPDAHQREVFMRNLQTPVEILAAYAAYLVVDRDLQQYVLEQNDINDKIDTLQRAKAAREVLS